MNVNNIRYADDTALLADEEKKLQDLLDVVVTESKRKGLEINKKKYFVMVMSKKTTAPVCYVTVKRERLEQLSCFNLGSMVTSDGKSDTEIKRRIGIAKTVCKKMKRLLTSRNVDLGTRIRLLKCYVWSTLLYGCETWTVSKTMETRLQAAEMWFYRKMLSLLGRKGVKCGSVTSCRGTAGPAIENYTQADKLYWRCLEEGSVRRSCSDRKNRG